MRSEAAACRHPSERRVFSRENHGPLHTPITLEMGAGLGPGRDISLSPRIMIGHHGESGVDLPILRSLFSTTVEGTLKKLHDAFEAHKEVYHGISTKRIRRAPTRNA